MEKISNSETQLPVVKVELVKCESCGLTEECTLAYISRIRERYNGKWICGLCIEAVKDEVLRSKIFITTEEALNRHVDFCKKFQSSSPSSCETEDPITAIGRILMRCLDSPRSLPSSQIRERPPLIRCESCFSSLSR